MPWVYVNDPEAINTHLTGVREDAGWVVALGDLIDEELEAVTLAKDLGHPMQKYEDVLKALQQEYKRWRR